MARKKKIETAEDKGRDAGALDKEQKERKPTIEDLTSQLEAKSGELEAGRAVCSELETKVQEIEGVLAKTRSAYRQRERELDEHKDRLTREQDKKLKALKSTILVELIEPYDNLARSVDALRELENPGEQLASFKNGIEKIFGQFEERFKKIGLASFDPTGESFDPNLHEAMRTQPVDQDQLDGKVLLAWEKGYSVGDTILRPAKVVVGKK